MLVAETTHHDIIITVITVLGGVIVAVITTAGIILQQGRKTRLEMRVGNGHTIGQAIARMEDQMWRHEERLDAVEVELRETRVAVTDKLDEHLDRLENGGS